MWQFIVAVFALLAGAFWVLSGGGDFVPEKRPEPPVEVAQVTEEPAPAEPEAQPAPQPDAQSPSSSTSGGLRLARASSAPIRMNAAPSSVAPIELNPAQDAAAPIELNPAPDATTPTELNPLPDASSSGDIRVVEATRVNMRSGPSTDYRVLDTLTQGTRIELLDIDDLGPEPWANLRVIDTGLEGWMALRFLSTP